MKALIALGLTAILVGCASTSVEVTDRSGNKVKIPAELYAVKMQQEYADKTVNKACDKINEPMHIPENIKVEEDGAWAIAMMAVTLGQAKEDCADAMADIAAANKPDSYLKYKIADKKATWGIITKVAGLGLTGACLFQLGGACDYGQGGSSSGNSYGDNWVFNQSTGGGAQAGSGGMHGSGGAADSRTSNNVNFGHGNVMGSDLSSSLAGMNDGLTFVNGGGTIDNSTDTFDSFNETQSGGDDSFQSDF